MVNSLPDIHEQAKKIKNLRKLKHDGGRAWIKHPQLHQSVKKACVYLKHETLTNSKQ